MKRLALFEILFKDYYKERYKLMEDIKILEEENKILEEENTILRNSNKFYKSKEKILEICPNVRGHRYSEIKLPNWYNPTNTSETGRKFTEYIEIEVRPTRINHV